MDVVENWKDFRHAEGILDVDLLLLWCDNVYRNLHAVATVGRVDAVKVVLSPLTN